MTREQSKTFLVSLGIAEPTEEQITNHLNSVNKEIKSEKDRADKFKAEADKVATLQAQLDEINSKGLSDVEKANKATEAALSKVAELERNIKTMQTQKQLAELGITGETAEKFISADGTVDFSVLGQILSDTKANAKAEREAELAGKAGNPGGSNGGSEPEKTADVQYAESYGKRMAESSKATNDALASYLK
jgi:hypothetical protein